MPVEKASPAILAALTQEQQNKAQGEQIAAATAAVIGALHGRDVNVALDALSCAASHLLAPGQMHYKLWLQITRDRIQRRRRAERPIIVSTH